MIRFSLLFALLSVMSLSSDSAVQQMAKELGLPPPRKTDKSYSDVKKEIKDIVDKKINDEVGFFDEVTFTNEAQVKFPAWKVGDTIHISDQRGFNFSGKIEKIDDGGMVIGGKGLNSLDYTDEIAVHVIEQKRNKEIYIWQKKGI
ncbi:MAG: hypothetical protein WCP55_08115 [Lentisphaerota bacterium]